MNTPLTNHLSLIIHTKNEEANIVDCIRSVQSIVDDIVVIDMNSADQTVKLAKKLGGRVYQYQDCGFADPARAFGIRKAYGPWILSLDADERISPTLAQTIRRIIDEEEYDVVVFPFQNIRLGKWMRHTGLWPDYHPRLFKKGFIKWPTKISQAHISPVIKGRVLTLKATEENSIIHYNVTNIRSYLIKMEKYYLLKGSGFFFKDRKLTPTDLYYYCKGEFKWRFIEQKGYLDGMRGYVFSKLREYDKFIEFVNWWEREKCPESLTDNELMELAHMEEYDLFRASKFFKLWQYYYKLRAYIQR